LYTFPFLSVVIIQAFQSLQQRVCSGFSPDSLFILAEQSDAKISNKFYKISEPAVKVQGKRMKSANSRQ
jgi:hypothetical protein